MFANIWPKMMCQYIHAVRKDVERRPIIAIGLILTVQAVPLIYTCPSVRARGHHIIRVRVYKHGTGMEEACRGWDCNTIEHEFSRRLKGPEVSCGNLSVMKLTEWENKLQWGDALFNNFFRFFHLNPCSCASVRWRKIALRSAGKNWATLHLTVSRQNWTSDPILSCLTREF